MSDAFEFLKCPCLPRLSNYVFQHNAYTQVHVFEHFLPIMRAITVVPIIIHLCRFEKKQITYMT